ncbi:MAG: LTA synthase family protein [Bacteroidetes bacterium]|nr:LTA synthase family protein [Bacteroidota bacterium]
MNVYKHQLKNLLTQIVFVFLLYAVCRLLFFYFNRSYFSDLSFFELLKLLFFGLRFDAFSIAATNALYILLCVTPFKYYHSKLYQGILSFIFVITNALAILLNFIDFAFFPFNQKRMTFDMFNAIFGGQTEFMKLLPHFLTQYWYLVILYALFIYVLIKGHKRINKTEERTSTDVTLKNAIIYFIYFVLSAGFTVLGIRGGLQKIPIVLVDAAAYTSAKFIPVVINTPFSVLKSADLTEMKPLTLMPEEEMKKYYNPIHLPDTGTFKNVNVCVIILESFSKEFTGISNRKSYTPFLDSLMSKSMLFTNAISNGKTSINGIPAVVASMPCFLDNQYLNSMYSNNTLQTLPNLLKEKGYSSVFYHGGTNGTMNFNSFAQLAGYDAYYGRTEFNNDEEYDGQWGIWDEPFLKKTAAEISTLKQPFFASIFTLSSHNPYKVPEKYQGKFPKGNYEITESIGYADYSLRQFFAEARKQPWFDNTLFVVTADHTSVSDDPFYSNAIGQHSIPLLIYKKDWTPLVEHKTIQHIDILPTILDYLNYDKPYYSFGQSAFSANTQPVIYYTGSNYYCVQDSFLYTLSNYDFVEKFNFKKDSLLTVNLADPKKDRELLNFCRAYIQNYNRDVIGNKTYYQPSK